MSVQAAMRRRRTLGVLGLVALLAGGGCRARDAAERQRGATHTGYAVIYARSRWSAETSSRHFDIWWQRLPGEEPLLVCTVSGSWMPTYLPSPDGRWLCVSHGDTDRSGKATVSRFFIVGLPDLEVVPLAEVPSVPRGGYGGFTLTFAPHWLDDSRLLLESNIGRAVFDVEERRFTEPLPEWPPKTLPESAYRYTSLPQPEDFIREHYADDLKCAQEAMAILGEEMGLDDYLAPSGWPEPDRLENMLARPLGIFTLSGYSGEKRAYPSLACSPNHR